jgi:hypothetical protein
MPVSGAFTGLRADPQSLYVAVKTTVLAPVEQTVAPAL